MPFPRSLTLALRHHWPALALLMSAAALAVAHASERFGGLAPCHLCLEQREVYWWAMALAGAGMAVLRLWPRPLLYRGVTVLLGIVFVGAAGLAAYHVGVELKWFTVPASCTAGAASLDFGGDLMEALSKPLAAPRCDEVPWTLFGVSMAGYNVLYALGLAGLSFAAAAIGGQRVEEPTP